MYPDAIMRSIVLASFLLVCAGLAGQSYIPLLDTSATWQDENATGSPGPNTGNFECLRYYLDGDSLVNDTTYQILRQTGRRSEYNNITGVTHTVWYDGDFTGLLREDTSSRRVYIRPPGWAMDWLLYDFSAEVGPYPSNYRFYQTPNLVVTSVDTVWLTDGPHRRINFGEYLGIIEGVGSTDGFMESGVMGEIHYLGQQVCHTVDGSANYIVNSFDCACGSNVSIPGHVPISIHVSPSPTTGICRLDGAPPNAPFVIHSMDGRVVLSGRCTSNGSAAIDISGLPAAIYLLNVIEATGSLRGKIVKE